MIVRTTGVKMNLRLYENVFRLYEEFQLFADELTCAEFLQDRLDEDFNYSECLLEAFVSLNNYEKFLRRVAQLFVEVYKPRKYDNHKLVVFLFYLMFGANKDSKGFKELIKTTRDVKFNHKYKVIKFLINEENVTKIALLACKYFEDSHVLKFIIEPLLASVKNFRKLAEFLKSEARFVQKKPPTVPVHLNVLSHPKRPPSVPLNTPKRLQAFIAQPVPQTLYLEQASSRLTNEYEKNRQKAIKLLATAKTLSTTPKPKPEPVIEPVPKFKAKKAPVAPQVQIKGTVSTVLRDANLAMKEQETEIKEIETLMQGGTTLNKFRQMEEEARRAEEQRMVDEVERKHLEGLLTFEESILAKKKVLDENKERFKVFMEEREEFLEKLEQWKEEEEIKIRALVLKGHETAQNARHSEKKLKEERKMKAEKIKSENRELLQKILEQKQEELAKKIKLIEEIKTLHQVRMLNNVNKKYDRCKCPDFGLLSQMSIGDLQEQIAETRRKMEKQLERKRDCINAQKVKQRQMIENVKNFIAQSRMSKPKSVPIRPTKLERSPDLDKLKSHLEYVRELRKTMNGNEKQLEVCNQYCKCIH